MNNRLEQLLIECLDALERGETAEQILARYPQEAAQLRPMLETAVALSQLNLQPSRAAQLNAKNAFLDYAASLRTAPQSRRAAWGGWRRLLAPLVTIFALALLGVGAGWRANTSLPGDALYGIKLLLEDAAMPFAPDRAAAEQARQERRIQEIQQLLALGRTAEVHFASLITDVSPETLLIGGLSTELTPQTVLTGEPVIGARAEVEALVSNGRLRATHIRITPPQELPAPTPTIIETAVPPQPSPPVSATATLTSTPTPESSITATPTSETAVATIQPSPTPTITHTPTPVVTPPTPTMPPPSPTATPQENTNNNDNGNDNDNNDNDHDNDNENSNDNDNGNNNDNGNDNDDD